MSKKATTQEARLEQLYKMANDMLYVLFSVQGTLQLMQNEGSIGAVGMEHIFGPLNLITDAVDDVIELHRGVL